jgi:uncharacterized membrane protein YtjA (UPF0391 family)
VACVAKADPRWCCSVQKELHQPLIVTTSDARANPNGLTPGDFLPPFFYKEFLMISWAISFLVIALIAAVLGFSGIAGAAVNIAWILVVVGVVLAIVFALMGRRPRG